MTKQHFIALAAEIAKIEDESARFAAFAAVARVARQFNSRFDHYKFMSACGL